VNRRKRKTEYMSDAAFAELKESLEQALAYERGARAGYHVTHVSIPVPPKSMSGSEIKRLRKRLNYSQVAFAQVLNVSTKTVQAWEQGVRAPSDAALNS
jgi:putative transcriptional regulator